MARRYRPRKLFKFWLYQDLTEDVRLMEYIDYLRKTRQFATILRSGLRLMWTLGQGDLSVLFELFPTLRSQFTPDNSALIEEFRHMLQAQAAILPHIAQPQPDSGSTAKSLPAPRQLYDDEDTILIRRDAHAGASTVGNFLNAAFAMTGQTLTLPDDDDAEPPPNLMPGSLKLKPLG